MMEALPLEVFKPLLGLI